MGLFGSSKDDTRAKIEELKAKMQSNQQQAPQQQPWQGQPQQAPEGWQPPREQQQQAPPQQAAQPAPASTPVVETSPSKPTTSGILLELGDGMSLNLPIREKMELTEFLRIADRVRELKKIDHA